MNEISKWIKDYCVSNKIDCLVVGVSGGVDSAVTSALCAKTGIRTICVSIPIHQKNNQLNNAEIQLSWLEQFKNVETHLFDLSECFESFKALFPLENNHALANSRSRLRMTLLYHLSTMNNGIVVGTGNKVEDFGVGFFTKYGDGGVDISPIADLYKSEVVALAKELNIDSKIISADPTDGLWDDGRTDEDQLGASYEELEWAMKYEGGASPLTKRQDQVLDILHRFNKKNSHKMAPIPVFKK